VTGPIVQFLARVGHDVDYGVGFRGLGWADRRPARRSPLLGRVVLASCEAFDNFPPGLTGKTTEDVAQLG
jgi:hypothetical protein